MPKPASLPRDAGFLLFDSTVSPNQKPATLNAVRMLTPSEIESLRLHKHETAAYVKAALSARTATATQ